MAVLLAVLAAPCDAGVFTDKAPLKTAVDEWAADASAAEATHGAISGWDVSRVDDLSNVFQGKMTFNAQLNWDTSKVTNMYATFNQAKAFNHPLAWDTSSVTTMQNAFGGAEAFNKPLSWDTSRVTTLFETFREADAFNRPLDWDTSKVTDMYRTFYSATWFNQPAISAWDVSKVLLNSCWSGSAYDGTCMSQMFDGSALASDECSKHVMHEAWKGVAAFTDEYSWESAACTAPVLARSWASSSPCSLVRVRVRVRVRVSLTRARPRSSR